MIYARTLLRVIGIACAFVSCVEEFDTTRRPHREASLGDNIYEALCNRLAIRENPRDVSGRTTRALCQGTGTPGAGTSERLKTLHNNRARLVQAFDATLGIDASGMGLIATDPHLASDVRHLLDQMLPLYDNGLMEKHNAAIGDWMQQLRDTSVTGTLAAHSTRQWYNQSVVQNANRDFAVPTAALPIMLRFSQLTDVGVAIDKVFGESAPDAPVFAKWLGQAQASLRAYEPLGMSAFLLDYLLKADAGLAGENRPLYSVLRNSDGDAQAIDEHTDVAPATLQTAPFGDARSARNSNYTRDAYGRLQSVDGKLLYDYQDLNTTPLAAGLRQVQSWMSKLAALDADSSAAGANASSQASIFAGIDWLSAALQNSAATGNDPNSPISEAISAIFAPEVFSAGVPTLDMLWNENELDVVKAIQLFADVCRRMDYDDLAQAKLKAGNTFAIDLIEVMQKITEHPDLLERVLGALQHLATAKLGPLFAQHMTTVDGVDYDPTNFRSSRAVGDFVTPVDRSQGDVLGNESVFQRLMHLVHDAYGLSISNNGEIFGYAPGELFTIDDAALFYLRSIVGNARMGICSRESDTAFFETGDALYTGTEYGEGMPDPTAYSYRYFIEYAMGLSGMTPVPPTQAEIDRCARLVTPGDPDEPDYEHVAFTYSISPQAAARMLFLDPHQLTAWNQEQEQSAQTGPLYAIAYPPSSMYDEPSIDGQPFRQLHGKTLFAWEKGDFHAAITPLLEAFAEPDPGAEEGNERLFLDLMNVLHKHWSTPLSGSTQNQQPARANYAAQTGLASFEPLLAFALSNPQNGGKGIFDVVVPLAAAVYEPEEAYEDAFIVPVEPQEGVMTADAHQPKARLAQGTAPDDQPGLPTAHTMSLPPLKPGAGAVMGALLDTFSELNEEQTQLANRETHALVSGLLGYMKKQLPYLTTHLQGDVKGLLANPLLPATLELLQAFNRAEPEAGKLVQALITHLVSDEQRPAMLNVAAQTLYTAADAKVDLRPLAKVAAEALDYPNGALPLTMKLTCAMQGVDTKGALRRVMANLGRALPEPHDNTLVSETPIDIFIDVYQQINRITPTDTRSLTADDHYAIIDSLAHFIQDDKQGFVRLLELIKHRHGN